MNCVPIGQPRHDPGALLEVHQHHPRWDTTLVLLRDALLNRGREAWWWELLSRGGAMEMIAIVRPHNPGLRRLALLDLPHDGAFIFNAACRTDALELTLDHCVRPNACRARLLTFNVVDSAAAKALVAVRSNDSSLV